MPLARTRLARADSRRVFLSYDRSMRSRSKRIERLPEQYFGALLRRVAAAGDVIDLGRGNPETGPPAHVVDRLTAAERPDVHGYSPFRGLPEPRKDVAQRYRPPYGDAPQP